MAEAVRLLIVDDHEVVRAGAREMLELVPGVQVSEASGGREALEAIKRRAPTLLLLDINLPDMSGLDVLKEVQELECAKPRVIVFTMNTALPYVLSVLRLGAHGFVRKDGASDELVSAVKRVSAGERYLAPELATAIAFLTPGADLDPLMRLSARELEVLRLLSQGHTLSSIARTVGVATKTVATTCAGMKSKLELDTLADLIRFGIATMKATAP
jgi:DNA-binding NarL/FixJ family response regulator